MSLKAPINGGIQCKRRNGLITCHFRCSDDHKMSTKRYPLLARGYVRCDRAQGDLFDFQEDYGLSALPQCTREFVDATPVHAITQVDLPLQVCPHPRTSRAASSFMWVFRTARFTACTQTLYPRSPRHCKSEHPNFVKKWCATTSPSSASQLHFGMLRTHPHPPQL